MKRCNDCQLFRRHDGIGWCAMRAATPQQWLAETCSDFEERPGCDRCAELESALRKVDEIRHEMKRSIFHSEDKRLIDDLKAPCMEVYK